MTGMSAPVIRPPLTSARRVMFLFMIRNPLAAYTPKHSVRCRAYMQKTCERYRRCTLCTDDTVVPPRLSVSQRTYASPEVSHRRCVKGFLLFEYQGCKRVSVQILQRRQDTVCDSSKSRG